jgi:hypothetical protein
MTIERQYGKIIFVCDQQDSVRCDEQIETEESDFNDALRVAKAEGWRSVPLDQAGGGAPKFVHVCGHCSVPR